MTRGLSFLWLVALSVGCAHAPTPERLPSEPPQEATPFSHCHARLPFPDPNCTPGVVNPNVTQENIAQTICVPGFTRTIRPPASYTSSLKVRQIVEYGYPQRRVVLGQRLRGSRWDGRRA